MVFENRPLEMLWESLRVMGGAKLRAAVGIVFLFSGSLALSMLVAEFGARFVFDPVDFLNPTMVGDDMLHHRIDGHTGGHDAWGFRNPRVPAKAEIVCIGDSMTYGWSAQMRDSWPAALGAIRGENVYNMALGGYGPIQYLHLMRERAVELRPKVVIVGLYLGNDFFDTYNLIHMNKNWSQYGTFADSASKQTLLISPNAQTGKFLGRTRDWLSRNSVLYTLATRLPLFDFVRTREMSTNLGSGADNIIAYRDARHHVLFDVGSSSRFLDMNDTRVKAAIEIAQRVMGDIKSEAERRGYRLVVMLLPTKERVYANLLKQAGYVDKHHRLAEALRQEDAVRDLIAGFLQAKHFDYVDVLPALEAESVHRDVYPLTDSHPNKVGYRVIAETVNHHLGR